MRTSWSQRLEDLRVLGFAAAVPLILRLRKLPGLPAWLEPAGGAGVIPPPPSPSEVDALVRRVDRLIAAGRPFVRYGCLVRGLTLYRFLRRAGAEVSLRFGVGMMGGEGHRADGEFAAHCWVVYQGEPLAEPRDPRPLFQETWRIEPGTP
jgi:Transglutaminase-like superfamily